MPYIVLMQCTTKPQNAEEERGKGWKKGAAMTAPRRHIHTFLLTLKMNTSATFAIWPKSSA